MNQLDTATLTEYIKHAIDLESAVVTQNQIIEEYEADSQKRKPVLNKLALPGKPAMNSINSQNENISGNLFILGCMAPVGIISLLALCLCPLWKPFWLIMTTVFLIGPIISLCYLYIGKAKVNKEYASQYQQYQGACKKIEHQNNEIETVYQRNLKQWNLSYKDAKNMLHSKLQESERTLQQYYSKGIIFPKYRNLPALTMMYEYLSTGRCSELTGPNGAYNLYESELRQNTIISQLNIVISQLETIKYNQYVLYEEVRKINYNTRRIASEMATIRGYTYILTELTALNTYYSGIAAQSASAMAFYQALS